MNETIVSMQGISKSFPGVKALDNVHFELRSGEVMALLGENGDHMSTPDIPDIATRDAMAATGEEIICKMVERMNMPHIVEQLRKLEAYGQENEKKYPWMPAAWNRNH